MKHEIKKIKHTFTAEEVAVLQRDFHQAIKTIKVTEAEFDSVKATYKAHITEAESRSETLSATIDAGFEMRDRKCIVIYAPKVRKKSYYPEEEEQQAEAGKLDTGTLLLTEDMTESDLQIELVEAEAKFELKESIELFPATENDKGILMVGKQNGKWFGALRVAIGGRKLEERLDGEQPCFKKRPDAVKKSVGRFAEWLKDALGKETALGFAAALDAVTDAHKDREE
jgi:hypothetical protein